MELILEIIFGIFGEFLLQCIFELAAHFGLAAYDKHKEKPYRFSAVWLFFGYVLLGIIAGSLSLMVFPEALLGKGAVAVVNLIMTPLLVAAGMCMIGKYRTKKDKAPLLIDTFVYAYTFALVFALIRFAFTTVA